MYAGCTLIRYQLGMLIEQRHGLVSRSREWLSGFHKLLMRDFDCSSMIMPELLYVVSKFGIRMTTTPNPH